MVEPQLLCLSANLWFIKPNVLDHRGTETQDKYAETINRAFTI